MNEEIRILILEDVARDADTVASVLRKAGIVFTSKRTDSKDGFLKEMRDFVPDIILADYTLLRFNALDAIHTIKEHKFDVSLIVVTESQDEEIAVECMKAGADDYILKTDLKRLPAALFNAIEKKENERKKETEIDALRSNEEQLRSLMAETSEVITILRSDGTIRYESPAVERVLGYRPEELVGKNFFELIHPADVPNAIHIHTHALQHPDVLQFMEFRFRHKDGEWRVFEAISKCVIDEESLSSVIVNSREITERKQVESELQKSIRILQKVLSKTVEAIALIGEKKDPYTAGHERRVAQLACAITREMRLSPKQIEGVHVSGLLHDVGKIAIPIEILGKPGKINEHEFNIIKTHSQIGYDILKGIEFPWPVATAVLQHHERLDGSGYPQGLTGEEIILEARVLAVADVVEAMSSHRPYRLALGIEKALEEIREKRGVLYDALIVDTCVKIYTEKGFVFE